MSVNARLLSIIPALLVASWLAVRSLAASPARNPKTQGDIGDPPVPFASLSREVPRARRSLRFIGALAAEARN